MPNESGNKPVLHTKKHIARLERERQQTRLIMYTFIAILVAVILLIGYGFLDINYLQLRKPVATVGDVKIIESDFEARVRLQRQQLLISYSTYTQYGQMFGMDVSQQLQQTQYYLDNPQILGQSVLDQMVNEEIVRQEAAKRGITVSADELDKYLHEQYQFFPNGTYTPTTTPTEVVIPDAPESAFKIVTRTPTANPTSETSAMPTIASTSETTTGTLESTLTLEPTFTPTATLAPTETPTSGPTRTPFPTATPYTLEGFQTQYDNSVKSFTKLGFTDAMYRRLLETQLLQDKLKAVITADVKDTEEEVWARHILVADESLAKTIIDRLKAGEDFSELAKQYSTDTASAANGGDLGWFGTGKMVPEFETAAFALKNPGDFTEEPVQSQFGYHIIQLIARQDRPLTASDLDNARSTAFTDWLTKAHDDYKIETFDFWKSRVPTEPNMASMSTEAANEASTQRIETASARLTGTPTP